MSGFVLAHSSFFIRFFLSFFQKANFVSGLAFGKIVSIRFRVANKKPSKRRFFEKRNRPKQRSGKAEFVFIRRIPLAVYCVIRRVRPTNSKLCDGGGALLVGES